VTDFTIALKADFFDNCYLQQDAYDAVDASTSAERQQFVIDRIMRLMELDFGFDDKEQARATMVRATDLFRNWNFAAFRSPEFDRMLEDIDGFIAGRGRARADASTQPVPATS
jgi:V/A-type H+/Na+-transporting ATPase subunit A